MVSSNTASVQNSGEGNCSQSRVSSVVSTSILHNPSKQKSYKVGQGSFEQKLGDKSQLLQYIIMYVIIQIQYMMEHLWKI